jgi:hypothetical protein
MIDFLRFFATLLFRNSLNLHLPERSLLVETKDADVFREKLEHELSECGFNLMMEHLSNLGMIVITAEPRTHGIAEDELLDKLLKVLEAVGLNRNESLSSYSYWGRFKNWPIFVFHYPRQLVPL